MNQCSRRVHRAAACSVLAVCLSLAAVVPAAAQRGIPAESWSPSWDSATRARYDACIQKTSIDPETAYEDGLIFRNDGGGVLARHCIALALLELGETEEAAARLEEAAFMPDGGDAAMRAELLQQAGNAWLLARAPVEAENAFSQAMTVVSGDPDLFIDRARARALQARFEDAVSDLDIALSVRPRDVLALRLRADAYFELGDLENAERDVEAALDINPRDVETLVERGRLREARRLGLEAMRDPGAVDPGAAPEVLPDAPAL
jgi:tetratricopeptide (TPR) repeat protein